MRREIRYLPLSKPDVLVRRVTLHAVADDASAALAVLHAAEDAIAPALEPIARAVGDEVLVLRRVDLRFAIDLDGGPAPLGAMIEGAMASAIRARIERARRDRSGPVVTEEWAFFPDEEHAVAAYLDAIARGAEGAFPYRLFTSWGASWPDVIASSLARGRAFLAGVLARVTSDPEAIVARVPEAAARAIVAAWTSGGSDRALDPEALPSDVREAIAEAASIGARSSPAHRDLLALARLFERWPPARDLDVPRRALDPLIRARAGEERGASEGDDRARERSGAERAPRLVSAAGGLLAWRSLLDHAGLSAAIDASYPVTRERRAVWWALGRALEDPSLSGADPLLLLWSGEAPGATVDPSFAIRDLDPEPLHRLALRAAKDLGQLDGALDVMKVGDVAAAMSGEICVDAERADDLHDAVPALVRRFSERVGKAPTSVHVGDRLSDDALSTWLDIDAPSVSDLLRPALRAIASVARVLLYKRWRARVSDARRWPAIISCGAQVNVEISRSNAGKMGEWRDAEIAFEGTSVFVQRK